MIDTLSLFIYGYWLIYIAFSIYFSLWLSHSHTSLHTKMLNPPCSLLPLLDYTRPTPPRTPRMAYYTIITRIPLISLDYTRTTPHRTPHTTYHTHTTRHYTRSFRTTPPHIVRRLHPCRPRFSQHTIVTQKFTPHATQEFH